MIHDYNIEKLKIETSTIIDQIDKGLDTHEAKQQIDQKIDQYNQDTKIILDPLIIQQFHYILAGYIKTTTEIRPYFIAQAIKSVWTIPEIKTLLKKKYGNNYTKITEQINKYMKILAPIKINIDLATNDPKILENPNHPLTTKINEDSKKLPLIYDLLYDVFTTIVTNSNIGQRTIPNSALLQYEKQYKKVQYDIQNRARDQYIDKQIQKTRSLGQD